jgi:hypothetical protein
MLDNTIGIKDLYSVDFKATSIIEINGKTFIPGEPVLSFDSLSVGDIFQNKQLRFSRGGSNNQIFIIWDNESEVEFNFSNGIFSIDQFAILNGSKVLSNESRSILLPYTEVKESDVDGSFLLKYTPELQDLYLYDVLTGNRITEYSVLDNKISVASSLLKVKISYYFIYNNNSKSIYTSNALSNNIFKVEAKFSVADREDAELSNGLLIIPKLRLTSNFRLKLGENYSPHVASFQGIGLLEGKGKTGYSTEVIFLEDKVY